MNFQDAKIAQFDVTPLREGLLDDVERHLNGEWFGLGPEKLNLKGRIEEADFGGPLGDTLSLGRIASLAFSGHLSGILLTIFEWELEASTSA